MRGPATLITPMASPRLSTGTQVETLYRRVCAEQAKD